MKVLLTGATGFIGSYLYPALQAAGIKVVCGTRHPVKASRKDPNKNWVFLDIQKPESIEHALRGCDAAFFLVHSMSDGKGYPEREAKGAENFRSAAEKISLTRIVYLGGVTPKNGKMSKHLRSRVHTGEILRGGSVSAIELRAGMIIGAGSASWEMVRDLAARLPAMILPRWLRNFSHPVGVYDIVRALMLALHLDSNQSHIFEVPGPERISHRDLLQKIALALGHKRLMLNVPVLSPKLSSYWIAAVTRVDLKLAQELVEGVKYNLEPSGESIWTVAGKSPMSIEEATDLAIADEKANAGIIPGPLAIERSMEIGNDFAVVT